MYKKKLLSALVKSAFVISFIGAMSTPLVAESSTQPASVAELFGLPLNNLSFAKLEAQLDEIGLVPYPSYKEGEVSYSLGPDGILGITNANIYINESGYINKALLSGVIEDEVKRYTLGEMLRKKYGTPDIGSFVEGIGRVQWFFDDATNIQFYNDTPDVFILYVDEHPRLISQSGRIDVEALAKKNR